MRLAVLVVQLALQQLVGGLEMPVAITHAGDERLFITLQRGEIVIWSWTSTHLLSASMQISTFGEDADGELYVASYDRGVIYRMVDQSPPLPKRRAVAH